MQQHLQDIPKQVKDVQKTLKRLQQQSASARSVWNRWRRKHWTRNISRCYNILYVLHAHVFVDSISFLLYSIYYIEVVSTVCTNRVERVSVAFGLIVAQKSDESGVCQVPAVHGTW